MKLFKYCPPLSITGYPQQSYKHIVWNYRRGRYYSQKDEIEIRKDQLCLLVRDPVYLTGGKLVLIHSSFYLEEIPL